MLPTSPTSPAPPPSRAADADWPPGGLPAPTDVSLAHVLGAPPEGPRPAPGFSLGLRYMAASALFFSAMSLLVKLAGEAGVPTMQIVFVRCAVMMACTLALARATGVRVGGHDRRTLFTRGLGGATALSLLYFALGRLPLGDATALHYTAPLWTAALAAPLLGEKAGRAVAGGLALSVAGVLLIARPTFLTGAPGLAFDGLAIGAALAGSFLSGLAYVFVRKLRATDDPLTVVFWLSWIGVALALPFVLVRWQPLTSLEWAYLIGVGLATQVAQVLMTRGLHLEAAGRATAIGYLQVVFAFAWGALVFDAVPDAWSLAGSLLIVGSVVLIARRT